MKPVRLCILGCGSIARLHSRIARTLGSVKLLFASRSLERAESYRRRFNGVGAFGSYEEACGSADVDAVFICTPHALHLDHARLAAAHGKPMLIEKPVTRSLEELEEMERVVRAAGVICLVAENYLFKPLLPVLRTIVEAGDIGDPIFVELNKTGRRRSVEGDWRADAAMMGGGALLEGGVHWVNLIREIGGPVEEVLAVKPDSGAEPRAPFEDNLQMFLKFENGSVGKLLHSWNTVNRIGGLQLSKIYGTQGNITFESNGLWALVLGRKKRLRVPGLLDIMGYRGMLKAFLESVRTGTPAGMSLEMARRDLAIVFAAYRSLDSKRFETAN